MAHTIDISPWVTQLNGFRDGNSPYEIIQPPPVVGSGFSALDVSATQIDLSWDNTVHPDATGYAVIRADIGGVLVWDTIATIAGNSASYSDTTVQANREYVYVLYPEKAGGDSYNYEMAMACTPPASGAAITTVSNNSELIAAASNPAIDRVLISPGNYTSAINGFVAGLDRSSNPITFMAADPADPPLFTNLRVSLSGTTGVRIYNWDVVVTETTTVFDEGDNGPTTSTQFCSFVYNKITGPTKDVNLRVPTPTYSAGMPNGFSLRNAYSHSNVVFGNDLNWVRQIGDFCANGNLLVAKNKAKYWYFDYFRFVGQPDDGRTAGDKYILQNISEDNIALYEEEDGTFVYDPVTDTYALQTGTGNSPHSDINQMFSVGGTNSQIEGCLFANNTHSNKTTFRGFQDQPALNVQWNLAQTYVTRTIHHENVAFTNRAHMHWINSGSKGVIINNQTGMALEDTSNPTIRIMGNTEQIITRNSIVPWGFWVDGSASGSFRYQLDDLANLTARFSTVWRTDWMVGPLRGETTEDLFTEMVPLPAYAQYGALKQDGTYRNGLHPPAMPADLPGVTAGSGQFTIDTLPDSTLMHPLQRHLGGAVYTYDLRYAEVSSDTWVEVIGVSESQVINGIASGSYDVQTRCVTNGLDGAWSNSATIAVS